MAQASWPIVGENFSAASWRNLFGDEAGVLGDMDGSSYKITLSTNSDSASIGSTTQDSIGTVGGHGHIIPANTPESITVPPAVGGTITHAIALKYDPTLIADLPLGPVRLALITGTSANLPNYDGTPPGPEFLPLWAVTRQPGQALSQAVVTQMFTRIGKNLSAHFQTPLPPSPLGTRARWNGVDYIRELAAGIPSWRPTTGSTAPAPLALIATAAYNYPVGYKAATYWRESRTAHANGTLWLSAPLAGLAFRHLATLPEGFRPTGGMVSIPTTLDARYEIHADGRIFLVNGSLVEIPKDVPLPLNAVIPLG
jgi:hypothetical protein